MNTHRFKPSGRPLSHKTRRDFPHARYFGVTPDILSQLPINGLGRLPFSRTNQDYTQFCTACATSTASAFIEGVEMSFEYQAAKIGQLSGEPILNGADPLKAMQAMVLYGSLPRSETPFTLDTTPAKTIADWTAWPAPLDVQAAKYEKESFFRIDTGPFKSKFDNIRVNLFQADLDAQKEAERTGQPKKEYVAVVFSQWHPQWSGATIEPDGTWTTRKSPTIIEYVPPIPRFSGIRDFLASLFPSLFGNEFWHAYNFIDWRRIGSRDVLMSQNSYPFLGDYGVQYFTREVVDAVFADPRAGCYLFRDIEPSEVKRWQAHQSSLAAIFNSLRSRL